MSFSQMLSSISEWWSASAPVQGKIIASVLMVAGIVILRSLATHILCKNIEDVTRGYLCRRRITYAASALALLLIGWTWLESLQSIAAVLGLVGAGLAVAMRDVVMDVAAWVFVHWRRPFYIGDRIEIAGHSGDVIDIRLFQFTVLEVGNWVEADQSTGRIIHIPNAKVLSEPLVNYTKDFSYIWNELSVMITFESDWQLAKSILLSTANEVLPDTSSDAKSQLKKAAHRYVIFFDKLTPIVYTKVLDSGVQLTIRYLVPPRMRRTTEHKLWEAILARFAEHDEIDFAYPTVRYYQTERANQQPSTAAKSLPGNEPK